MSYLPLSVRVRLQAVNDQRAQSLLVYQMLHLNRAIHCVNQLGGSICACSDEFNAGVQHALEGVVSARTWRGISSHMLDGYFC